MLSTLIQHQIIDLIISDLSSFRENDLNWNYDLFESMSFDMWRKWIKYTLVSKNWLKYISTHTSIAYLSMGLIDALHMLNNLKINRNSPNSNRSMALITPTHLVRKISTRIDASRHEQIYPLLYNLKRSHYSNLQSLTIHFSIVEEPTNMDLSEHSREEYRYELNNNFTTYKQLYISEWARMVQESDTATLEKSGLLEKDNHYIVAKFLTSLPTDNVSIHLHLESETMTILAQLYSFNSINTDIININRFTINCTEMDQPIKSLLLLVSHNQYNNMQISNDITRVRFQHLDLPAIDYMGTPSDLYYILLKYTMGDEMDRQQQQLNLHECFMHFSSISFRTTISWDLATSLFKIDTITDLEIALSFLQNPDQRRKEIDNSFIEEYSRTMESISLNSNLQRLKLTLYPLLEEFGNGVDYYTYFNDKYNNYYNLHSYAIISLCRSIGGHQKLAKLAITGIPFRESRGCDAAKFLFSCTSLSSISFSCINQRDLKTICMIFTEVQNPNTKYLSIQYRGIYHFSMSKDEMYSYIDDIGKLLSSTVFLKKLVFVYNEIYINDGSIEVESKQLFKVTSSNPNKNIVFQYAPFKMVHKKGIYYPHEGGLEYDYMFRHAWRIINSKKYELNMK